MAPGGNGAAIRDQRVVPGPVAAWARWGRGSAWDWSATSEELVGLRRRPKCPYDQIISGPDPVLRGADEVTRGSGEAAPSQIARHGGRERTEGRQPAWWPTSSSV